MNAITTIKFSQSALGTVLKGGTRELLEISTTLVRDGIAHTRVLRDGALVAVVYTADNNEILVFDDSTSEEVHVVTDNEEGARAVFLITHGIDSKGAGFYKMLDGKGRNRFIFN